MTFQQNDAPTGNAARAGRIRSMLQAIFADITRLEVSEIDWNTTFLEMGADSLSLLQASQAIQDRFNVRVSLGLLLDELSTIGRLAAHLDGKLAPDALLPAIPSNEPTSSSPRGEFRQPQMPLPGTSALAPAKIENENSGLASSSLESIAQQLQTLQRQLDLLRDAHVAVQTGAGAGQVGAVPPDGHPPTWGSVAQSVSVGAPQRPAGSLFRASDEQTAGHDLVPDGLAAYQPVDAKPSSMSPQQLSHVEHLISRLVSKTPRSKSMAQAYRSVLADRVVSAGFRLPWKEMCYPIVADRGSGSAVWDVDGNQYVDIAMGFGSLLFGHSPKFVLKALEQQPARGMRLGLQSELAGQVAALVREMTGVERVSFCNSGTEAVMTALRLARTVTGRTGIALFAGSYHGTFDGVLARNERQPSGALRPVPLAPGVPPHMIENLLVLPYGTQESLEILEQHVDELAAVLVEPVPGRQAEIAPKAYLTALRRLTQKAGAALIFDEVVVGFRMHPGGAQALFNVQADIVTYGKAVASGMPIGIVAGRAAYMDAIDGGGEWRFGDESAPTAEMTLFAGTFFKHPMVMASALASLVHMRARGPGLQDQLSRRTSEMVQRLNADCAESGFPLRAIAWGSMFRFAFQVRLPFADLFYYHLLDHGVYVCDTRTCYLSTAHTDEDIDLIIRAVKTSLTEMSESGFLPVVGARPALRGPTITRERSEGTMAHGSTAALGDGTGQPSDVQIYPSTDGQKGLWTLAQMGAELSRAYNESVNLRMRGPCDIGAMRRAIQRLVARHAALRTTFSPDGQYQRISPALEISVPLIDFSLTDESVREVTVEEWLAREIAEVFDMEHGPLLRARLLKLGDETHLLALTLHHIIIDSWSLDILLRELGALYSEECLGVPSELPAPVPFSVYTSTRSVDSAEYAEDETYWLQQYADDVPVVNLPTDRARPVIQSYAGARECLTLAAELCRELKTLSNQCGCTLFTIVLAAFQVLLRQLTGLNEMVIGVHLAGQSTLSDQSVVGFCIEMLPLRGRVDPDATFKEHVTSVKRRVLEAVQHHHYPMRDLIRALKLVRDPGQPPLVTVVFNMDSPIRLSTAAQIPSSVPPWWGLQLELVASPILFARFEQVWNLVEQGDELVVQCTYNADLFDRDTVRDWLSTFAALLRVFLDRPESMIAGAEAMLTQMPSSRPPL